MGKDIFGEDYNDTTQKNAQYSQGGMEFYSHCVVGIG